MKLTPREREIICYVGMGYRPKEIAYDLGVSYKTVSVYMRRLFFIYQVQNINQLILKLNKKGDIQCH